MSGHDDLTPQLRAWLREPVSLQEGGVTEVSRAVHREPQQRGLLPPLSATWLSSAWSATGAVAAVAFVVALGGLLFMSALAPPVGDEVPVAAPPGWRGVEFQPLAEACADGCDWDEGGVWSVGAAHHGDFGSTQAIAFGPSGAPWFLSDDSVWQLGVPGGSFVSPMSTTYDLEVTSDGVLWVAGDLGLHSYDGRDWTTHWSGSRLHSLHVTPDDAVYAVGGGGGDDVVAVVRDEQGVVTSSVVDVIEPDRYPTSIAMSSDGRVWVSAIASGYFAPAEGESLIAYSDGAEWRTARPLGAGVDVAASSLVRGPEGSVWSLLSAITSEGGEFWRALARYDGQDWTVRAIPVDDTLDFGALADVGPDGATWFLAGGGVQDGLAGAVDFAGSSWTRYLGDREFGVLALAPDGTALVTTIPGFDEEGELFAIRRAPSQPTP
jgi:hypothetical protein